MKNVLLVTVDSVRADLLSEIEAAGHTSTVLRELASRGDSFERAYATGPGTSPSFPALLTGTYALDHGGLGPLSESRPRLSESLSARGLETGGFHSNPFLSTHFNYDVGFDQFEDYQHPLMGVATKLFPRGIELNNPRLERIDDAIGFTDAIKKAYQLVKGKPRPYVSAEVITDDTLAWLAGTQPPFFCWAHYMDVHHPCFPPESYRDSFGVANVTQTEVSEWYARLQQDPAALSDDEMESLLGLYRAAFVYVDDQIRRLIEYLTNEGIYDETLVILTSDHGELFGEHGEYGKPARMYDELLHVPLVVENGPDYLGEHTEELISLIDVPPVIHDALGIPVPDDYAGRCPSVDQPREWILAEHQVEDDVVLGVRSRSWLYEFDGIRDTERLFEMSDGRLELRQLESHPDAEWLKQVAIDRLGELDVDTYSLESIETDVEDRLEDLGYL